MFSNTRPRCELCRRPVKWYGFYKLENEVVVAEKFERMTPGYYHDKCLLKASMREKKLLKQVLKEAVGGSQSQSQTPA